MNSIDLPIKQLISNELEYNQKLSSFINSYSINPKDDPSKDKLIYITDFDYTMTEKFNYENKGSRYKSSFGMYTQEAFGGDQMKFLEYQNKSYSQYVKYEDDTSIPENIRKEKNLEWYSNDLKEMANPLMTRESFKKMVEISKPEIKFRQGIKELFEVLMKLNIPIIIVSAGIKEIIEECLKLLNIEGIEDYMKKKRMFILGNEFIYDKENGKCVSFGDKVVYPFSKSLLVKELVRKNFPNVERIFILGDNLCDYNAVDELLLKKENIIGFGFINYKLNEIEKGIDLQKDKKISDYKKVFDVVLLKDEGYEFVIEMIKKFIKK